MTPTPAARRTTGLGAILEDSDAHNVSTLDPR